MDIDADTVDAKEAYFAVFHKFEVTNGRIEEARQEIRSFLAFTRESSVQKVIFEKMTDEDVFDAIEFMKIHASALDLYINAIRRGLDLFEEVVSSGEVIVKQTFIEIAEKVVQLFGSVQIQTENRLKEIQEKNEEFRNLTRMDES